MKIIALAAALLAAPTVASADTALDWNQPLSCQVQSAEVTMADNGQNVALRSITPQTRTAARAFGFGGVAQYAVLPGSRALLRTANRRPSFIVSAPSNVQPQGLFTLARFEPRPNNSREVLIGGGFMSYSSGVSPDRIVQMDVRQAESQRGAPAGSILYTLTPMGDLPAGEYAMIVAIGQQAGMMAGLPGTYFDFGVD